MQSQFNSLHLFEMSSLTPSENSNSSEISSSKPGNQLSNENAALDRMVRVISIHHFSNQCIQTVEQPMASAVAAPNYLLLALTSHCIEVRDLSNNGDVLFTFPTVDEVRQIVYSLMGNYVATLERNRQNAENHFVRVYVNWDSVATLQQSKMTSSGVSLGSTECGMVQPMRARIAGRVTPTTNQSELGSLEMIEIPAKRNTNLIACCQVSGNILILSSNVVSIYYFMVKIHDISKMRFIDFEECPLYVDICFKPIQVELCENYVACMNASYVHMFKIVKKHPSANGPEKAKRIEPQGTIDYKKLLEDEFKHPKKEVTVHLKTIVKENSLIHKYSPNMFCNNDVGVVLRDTSLSENHQQIVYEVHDLIQLKVANLLYQNTNGEVAEAFRSMVVKPLYVDQGPTHSKATRNASLRSKYKKSLFSVICMVATQQEGYLYEFYDKDLRMDSDHCIAVYPFTAPVQQLVMEDYFLHALTETGLESYTLRIAHQVSKKMDNFDFHRLINHSGNDSICLVGLRPFLGVEKILLTEKSLVLLASGDSSPTHSIGSNSSSNTTCWTLYNLELPNPIAVFNDFLLVANVHRFSSPQTYCHLMKEAYLVLRTAVLLSKWTYGDGAINLVPTKKPNLRNLLETYRTSCALLGDHYILCLQETEYSLALTYYKMAGISPPEVLARVKKVQEQSNSLATKGLIYYLKTVFTKFEADADKEFELSSKQDFFDSVLELFENHNLDDLPKLVLQSSCFRQYSSDKVINLVDKKITNDNFEQSEKALALTVLYLQKGNQKIGNDLLNEIDLKRLKELLLENWELLFENATSCRHNKKDVISFSELSVLLFQTRPEFVVTLLMNLITNQKSVSLAKVLKAFLEYLPSSIGTEGNKAGDILQKILESYFLNFFKGREGANLSKLVLDKGEQEGLKILVRSHLSRLQMLQFKEEVPDNNEDTEVVEEDSDEDLEEKLDEIDDVKYKPLKPTFVDVKRPKESPSFLLSTCRKKYLDKMPPLSGKLQEKHTRDAEADTVLMKLQALLCSSLVPKQMENEVEAFLGLNETLRGNASLRSIIMDVKDAVPFLLDVCPKCLLQFAKDRVKKSEDFKVLISTLQHRLFKVSKENNHAEFESLKKLLKSTLAYAAETLTLDNFLLALPMKDDEDGDVLNNYCEEVAKEITNYEPYIEICKDMVQAKHLRHLIMNNSHMFLNMMDL